MLASQVREGTSTVNKWSLASGHSQSEEGGEFVSLFVYWTVFYNTQIGVAECGEP